MNGSRKQYRFDEILKIEVKQTPGVQLGMLVGVAVFGVAAIAETDNTLNLNPSGAVGSMLIGAGIGAVVGLFIPAKKEFVNPDI